MLFKVSGTLWEAIFYEFDEPRPRGDGLKDACGSEWSGLVVKRSKGKEAFHGGKVRHMLEHGYVPKVYKDLWIPPSEEYPRGESLVVMQRMGRDALGLLWSYPAALSAKRSWIAKFNRLHMVLDLVTGLKYAHSYYLIHRDTTLSNLMQQIPTPATGYYRFQIIDWDTATNVDQETLWDTKGSPRYMAPEVAKQQNRRWPYGSDVYSAGICLLFAVQPHLLSPQYTSIVEGIHYAYFTPEGIKDYLATHLQWNRDQYPDVLNLLSKVLCGPQAGRITMADFETSLLDLMKNPSYNGDLPLIRRR